MDNQKKENVGAEEVEEDVASEVGLGADFESVFLDGCLGFGLSICNTVAILFAHVVLFSDAFTGGMYAIGTALFGALLLLVGSTFSDWLQRQPGRRITLYGYVVTDLAAVIFLFFNLPILSLLCAVTLFGLTIFLYARFLNGLDRRALAIIVNVIFLVVGAIFLSSGQFERTPYCVLACVIAVISCLASWAFSRKPYKYADFVSQEESKKRSIKVKGNNHTLLLLGFLFGASLVLLYIDIPLATKVSSLGAAIGCSGVLSLLLGQIDERKYKNALIKSISFITCLLIIPCFFVPPLVQLVLISVFVCYISLNVIVMLNAVVETSRFDLISPIWLCGHEGAVFLAGSAANGVLLMIGTTVLSGVSGGMHWVGIVAVAFCAWMQIKVNYQVYPFEPVIQETDEQKEQNVHLAESAGRRKTLWQQKRKYAGELYKLSPREKEVLHILLKGRDAKYIMDTFYISQSTAKTHIYNIYHKFGVHSRQDLIDFVEDIELPAEQLQDVDLDADDR